MINKNFYIEQNSAYHLDVFTIYENETLVNYVETGSVIKHSCREYLKPSGKGKQSATLSKDIGRRVFEMLTTYGERDESRAKHGT